MVGREGPVEGGWVDRVVGLEGVRVDVAMLETPDGHRLVRHWLCGFTPAWEYPANGWSR